MAQTVEWSKVGIEGVESRVEAVVARLQEVGRRS